MEALFFKIENRAIIFELAVESFDSGEVFNSFFTQYKHV